MVNIRISKALLAGRIRLKQCQLFSTAVCREENIIESTYKVRSGELQCEELTPLIVTAHTNTHSQCC